MTEKSRRAKDLAPSLSSDVIPDEVKRSEKSLSMGSSLASAPEPPFGYLGTWRPNEYTP
jgi:hypothetical protein